MNKIKSNKAAVQYDELVKWIIGLVVFIALLMFYLKLSGSLNTIIESIKNIFRF